MVILGRKFGRLANRLWVFTNFAANAIEYKYPLCYRNFDEYIDFFTAPAENNFEGYPIKFRLSRNKLIDRLLYWRSFIWFNLIVRGLKKGPGFSFIETTPEGKAFDLNRKDYLRLASDQKKDLYIGDGGFWFMDNENTIKHKNLIKHFLRPKSSYQKTIDTFIAKCRSQSNCLVGIHMRKGDYRRFEKGKNFYPDSVYCDHMRFLQNELSQKGLNPTFVLCSDEPIEIEHFRDLAVVTGPGHFITDLYTLAQCDYLLGPPSSYTLWASFYGDVPLKFLMEEKINYKLNDFRIVTTMGDAFTMQGRDF